ncbi:unnamed protein product [Meloidogyne enterolobii]|uniref:Uncharacterized protein n=1 Tax=Meloidogyne enterolobii TaxID=390850 RepID=A0ACB1AVS9_MELEN
MGGMINGYRYDHIDGRGNYIDPQGRRILDSQGRRMVFYENKPMSPRAKQFWLGFLIGFIIFAIISYNLAEKYADKKVPHNVLLLTLMGGGVGGFVVGLFLYARQIAKERGSWFGSEETKAGELFLLGLTFGFIIFAAIFGYAAYMLSPHLERFFEDKEDLKDFRFHACIIGGLAMGLIIGASLYVCQKNREQR